MSDDCPHYCDNQGFCHRCGILMEPQWYDWYINGPPADKPDTIKMKNPPKPRKKRK